MSRRRIREILFSVGLGFSEYIYLCVQNSFNVIFPSSSHMNTRLFSFFPSSSSPFSLAQVLLSICSPGRENVL